MTFAAADGVLLMLAATAAWQPAREAERIDPVEALEAEYCGLRRVFQTRQLAGRAAVGSMATFADPTASRPSDQRSAIRNLR